MAEMRRALAIGIDDYPGAPLGGCVQDASMIGDLLRTHDDGSSNFDVRTVLSPGGPADRASLEREIEKLFESKADTAVFFFSGHGSLNVLGAELVARDGTIGGKGYPLRDLVALAAQSPIDEIVMILDCCYSGDIGSTPILPEGFTVLREGMSLLTASRAKQPTLETLVGGVFTTLVCEALTGGAADVLGQATVASVYAYVERVLGPWDQRPIFKSNLSSLTTLRRCRSTVAKDVLKRMITHFRTAEADLQLDPSYEASSQAPEAANVAVLRDLQKLRAAGLVAPVGEEHLYYAAMNSKPCRLTPLGRFYWHLARKNRI